MRYILEYVLSDESIEGPIDCYSTAKEGAAEQQVLVGEAELALDALAVSVADVEAEGQSVDVDIAELIVDTQKGQSTRLSQLLDCEVVRGIDNHTNRAFLVPAGLVLVSFML